MRYVFLILPLLFLAACASLSEDECRAGNWFGIGKEDGSNGRLLSFIDTHAEACAEYGIAPDRRAWARGRAEGLTFYCTSDRAFNEGRRGRTLAPVCGGFDLARLERANEKGLQLHWVEDEIREVESEIRGINTQIAALPADDTGRAVLASERSSLRLDLLRLLARRARLL